VEELHQRVTEEWNSVDQRVIDSAIIEWHDSLSASVAADGEYLQNAL